MTKQIEIDYTRYYKKWHNDTTEHIEKMIYSNIRLLNEFIPENKSIKILDVGCGMGFAMLALKRLGYNNVQGIDISKGQIESCLSKGLDVIHVNDPTAYLFENKNQYDLIISLDVIEHVPIDDQLNFTHAICQALKHDGKFICTVPNANSSLASRWRYNDWTHHSSFTENSLDFLLFNAGFQTINISETELKIPKYTIRSILHWLMIKFFRAFRRLEVVAELGLEGRYVPLSLNLLAIGKKKI